MSDSEIDFDLTSTTANDFYEGSPPKLPKNESNPSVIEKKMPSKTSRQDSGENEKSEFTHNKRLKMNVTGDTTTKISLETTNNPRNFSITSNKSEIFFGESSRSSQSSQSEITTGVPRIKTSTNFENLLINPKQRGNPLMKFISNVPWEYSEIVPDYAIGQSICILFLSLRYHQLNPDYIHDRLKQLGKAYNLRVLLVQVDVPEPHHSLKHLTRICILADLTLMLAWNAEDAGRIIETYKIYEKKPPDMIMEKTDAGIQQRVMSALTSVRSINKTDAMTLLNNYGSLAKIIKAPVKSLALCPGIGLLKAQRLHKALHETFLRSDT